MRFLVLPQSQPPYNNSKPHLTGCHDATRLLLRHQREDWEWGDFPRSYSTYQHDNLITISANEFSKPFYRTRSNTLSPWVQWTSLQILLRTLWTNLKEQRTIINLTSLNPVDPICSNCRSHPENTAHLVFKCQLAQNVWSLITATFNECATTMNDNYTPIGQHLVQLSSTWDSRCH